MHEAINPDESGEYSGAVLAPEYPLYRRREKKDSRKRFRHFYPLPGVVRERQVPKGLQRLRESLDFPPIEGKSIGRSLQRQTPEHKGIWNGNDTQVRMTPLPIMLSSQKTGKFASPADWR